jgi:hypothetical protein
MPRKAREAVHQEPVWRDRSNFVIAVEIPFGGETKTEQLWARQIDDHRFESTPVLIPHLRVVGAWSQRSQSRRNMTNNGRRSCRVTESPGMIENRRFDSKGMKL